MKNNFAEEFNEILNTLIRNNNLKVLVNELIQSKPISGKALEGGEREQKFKSILIGLINGNYKLDESFTLVEQNIPKHFSVFSGSRQVFSDGWAKRLVKTNLSKFYNQAVLLTILNNGQKECFIPHSGEESRTSLCSLAAGKQYDAQTMLNRLVEAYENGNYSKDLKIPNHPHCTHVVIPVSL